MAQAQVLFLVAVFMACWAALDAEYARSCQEYKEAGYVDTRPYTMYPDIHRGPYEAVCDMSQKKAWTVIQQRMDGSTHFIRTYSDYEVGFGNNKIKEYWLGNSNIHYLTKAWKMTKLRITLGLKEGQMESVDYGFFHVDGPKNRYTLTVGNFSGQIFDAMASHNGMPFTTIDRDNLKTNCGMAFLGGWWYNDCGDALLNGAYRDGHAASSWKNFTMPREHLQWSEMKIQ